MTIISLLKQQFIHKIKHLLNCIFLQNVYYIINVIFLSKNMQNESYFMTKFNTNRFR